MPSVGLVLSGGMAKGAYQLGALRAVSELFSPEEFSMISCASVGTLNGYAFAMRRLAQAEELWLNLCESTERRSIGSVLRSAFLQQGIDRICRAEDVLPVCCYTTLVDIGKRRLAYCDLRQTGGDELARYLKASVAMPICNHAVQLGENAFFDGAMVDNIPIYPLLRDPPDYILCVYFDRQNYTFENRLFDSRILKLTFPAEHHLVDSVMFRKETIRQMMESGYRDTARLLEMVFCDGKDDTARIYRRIASLNRLQPTARVRVTGDVIVSNINRVAQKFARRDLI